MMPKSKNVYLLLLSGFPCGAFSDMMEAKKMLTNPKWIKKSDGDKMQIICFTVGSIGVGETVFEETYYEECE